MKINNSYIHDNEFKRKNIFVIIMSDESFVYKSIDEICGNKIKRSWIH